MRITNDVADFIRKKVNAKVACVSVEQDFNDAVALVKQFETELAAKVERAVQAEFDTLINAHPELDGAELINPLNQHCRIWLNLGKSSINLEYAEARKLREDYVDEIVQRICIDATSCKNTEKIITLIDKIVG